MAPLDRFTARQLAIVFLIAAVQFVNILDFVMVMPLGPDFAKALGFSESDVGYVGGAYTAAACLAGLAGAEFLDRFDRRTALFVAMLGLVSGTALGGLANGFTSLIGARLLAGMFGGPATALAFAIITDAVPSSLRGRALGIVMAAFSIASVLGVPIGLWISEHAGWRAPFFSVALFGVGVSVGAAALLPSMRGHLERGDPQQLSTLELVSRPLVRMSYLMMGTTMMAGFVLIPNISGYLQLNLGYPRDQLKYLYLFGGIASLVCMQLAGWLVDHYGSFRTSLGGSVVVVFAVFAGFFVVPALIPPQLFFVLFMGGMALRNVSYSTLNTKVPEPQVRARYQSLSSAVQHGASALAAMLSAQLLTRVPREAPAAGRPEYLLSGMPRVAVVAVVLTGLVPVLIGWIEARLVARDRGESLIPKAAVR